MIFLQEKKSAFCISYPSQVLSLLFHVSVSGPSGAEANRKKTWRQSMPAIFSFGNMKSKLTGSTNDLRKLPFTTSIEAHDEHPIDSPQLHQQRQHPQQPPTISPHQQHPRQQQVADPYSTATMRDWRSGSESGAAKGVLRSRGAAGCGFGPQMREASLSEFSCDEAKNDVDNGGQGVVAMITRF